MRGPLYIEDSLAQGQLNQTLLNARVASRGCSSPYQGPQIPFRSQEPRHRLIACTWSRDNGRIRPHTRNLNSSGLGFERLWTSYLPINDRVRVLTGTSSIGNAAKSPHPISVKAKVTSDACPDATRKGNLGKHRAEDVRIDGKGEKGYLRGDISEEQGDGVGVVRCIGSFGGYGSNFLIVYLSVKLLGWVITGIWQFTFRRAESVFAEPRFNAAYTQSHRHRSYIPIRAAHILSHDTRQKKAGSYVVDLNRIVDVAIFSPTMEKTRKPLRGKLSGTTAIRDRSIGNRMTVIYVLFATHKGYQRASCYYLERILVLPLNPFNRPRKHTARCRPRIDGTNGITSSLWREGKPSLLRPDFEESPVKRADNIT
ncbi:hypothetical protein K439DRAFT_1621969 [Ramaria rubella]|nr:hypothetical protein K439DRAFT_1621969 [Ramaria rubella]